MTASNASDKDILRILLSILLPPVGVALQIGFSAQFWINVVLTLLSYVSRASSMRFGSSCADSPVRKIADAPRVNRL